MPPLTSEDETSQFFRLRYKDPSGSMEAYDALRPKVLIGRSPECDVCICILDPRIARLHAEVRVEGGRAWLHPFSVRADIRLNGQLIFCDMELSDGDTFACGPVQFWFETTSATLRETS